MRDQALAILTHEELLIAAHRDKRLQEFQDKLNKYAHWVGFYTAAIERGGSVKRMKNDRRNLARWQRRLDVWLGIIEANGMLIVDGRVERIDRRSRRC